LLIHGTHHEGHKEHKEMDERFTIETPENIAFDYEVAGIGSRFIAAAIDTLLLGLFMFLTLLGGVAFYNLFAQISEDLAMAGLGILLLAQFIIFWGYYVIFDLIWQGQSPGKRLVGLRVIEINGYPVTLFASVVRNLVRLIDFLPSFYGVGVIVMFLNSRARRLGDLAAGTVVVKERRDLALARVVATASPAPAGVAADTENRPTLAISDLPNLHRLTPDDDALIRDFLTRQQSLPPRRAYELAVQIADLIARKIEYQAYDPHRPEAPDAFLRRVLAARHKE